MAEVLTVREALRQAIDRGLPRSEGFWLLARVTDRPRAWLLAHDDAPLAPDQSTRWQEWLGRRLDDEPLAYLTGDKEFHGLTLHVTPAVLDPRPDTETLVDWALACLTDVPSDAAVLDLGTGSGAIALALKHRLPDLRVTAVDASADALAVARDNGDRLGLAVRWLRGSWFEPVTDERFHLIVSNPPYIAEGDPHLAALRHEPQAALTSGTDGLDALRHLVAHGPAHLHPGGWLLLEHGHDQGAAVARLFEASPDCYEAPVQRADLAGHVRCTGARRR